MKPAISSIILFSIIFIVTSCDKDSGNPVEPLSVIEYGTIVVSVMDQYEFPFEGLAVHLEPQNGDSTVVLATDAKGVARFDSLPAGTFDISSSTGKMDGDTLIIDHLKTDISVSGNQVVPVSIEYQVSPVSEEMGAVVCRLFDINGEPFEDVLIGIKTQDGESVAEMQTNEEGIARFDSLPPSRHHTMSFSSGRMNGETLIIDDQMNGVSVLAGEVVPVTYNYTFDPGNIGEFGTLIVRIMDEHENPFQNAGVTLYEVGEVSYASRDHAQTNEEGIARFDSIPPGQYGILESIRGSSFGKRNWMYDLTVSGGETFNVTLYHPVGPIDMVVKAELMSESNSDYDYTTIFFPDLGQTVLLDKQGNGMVTDFVIDYTLPSLDQLVDITRNDITIRRNATVKRGSDGKYYYDVVISELPDVNIMVEHEDAALSDRSFLLTATGYDFEDGDLPDEAFSWTSDIDGELGVGRNISPTLSPGQHKITLTGEDSVGSKSTARIIVSVSHFSDRSYFPLPHDGVWKYRYTPSSLVSTNNKGETGRWTLDDMTVMSHDTMSRTCIMEWNAENDGAEVVCQYSLTDTIVFDANRSLVTVSDEKLIVFDGDEVVEELSVETEYTPPYPLLADYLDPQAVTQEETIVTSESDMKYTRPDIGTRSWSETETIIVSYETGSPEDVVTDSGTYTAIPVQSTSNGVERTWWLSRGIGIVRMEYDLFGETVTASLQETNMADFAGGAGKRAAMSRESNSVRIQLDSSTDNAVRMNGIMKVMRGMCPR